MRTAITPATVLVCGALVATVAFAQANRWDGTWTGMTDKGSPVEIVMSGETITSFSLKGEAKKTESGSPSGRGYRFIVSGKPPAVVELIRQQGETASYRFSGMDGAFEQGMLTRK